MPAENLNPETKKTKRPYRRKARSRGAIDLPDQKEIKDCLTSIYQDETGSVPNMRRISVKKNNSVFKTVSILIGAIALLCAGVWAYLFFVPANFSNDAVTLALTGPKELTLGATTTYTISYQNRSNNTLHDVSLNIYYPSSFAYVSSSLALSNTGHTEWDLQTLAPYQKGELTIVGINYGEPNEIGSWRVFLNYTPENFKSPLQKTITLNTTLSNSPLSLTLSGPDKVTVGTPATFTFTVKNTSDWKPSLLYVTPELPANFTLTSSTPALDKNKHWPLNLLSAATSTPPTFVLTGTFNETTDDVTPLRGTLSLPLKQNSYRLAQVELAPTLLKNQFNFNIAVNGSTDNSDSQPGDLLTISLRLKNTSSNSLKKATIQLALDAPALKKQSILDWAHITDPADGDIQGKQISDSLRRGTITWNSKKIPGLAELKANDEATIDLRLPIKNAKDFDVASLTESKITALASVTFTDSSGALQTLTASPLTITLNSDLAFESRDSVGQENGKETHDLSWVLTNTFHTLKNISLTADLFGDIDVVSSSPTAGTLNYDAANKKLSWTIAELPDSVDVATAPFTITLNAKNPTQNTLVSKVHVTAEDTVTGKTIDFLGEETVLK